MRAIVSLRLLLAVALLTGLASAFAPGSRGNPAAAAPAALATGCVVGAQAVSNGSFEQPGLGEFELVNRDQTPTG